VLPEHFRMSEIRAPTRIMQHILVIDDDNAVRAAVKAVLAREGYDVTAAEDGRSGLAAIDTHLYDLIIVDIFMPGMDGLEAIRRIKQHAPLVPIIAISGFLFRDSSVPAPDFLTMATKLGAAGGLHKPFRPHELLAAVRTCLAQSIRMPTGVIGDPITAADRAK
jgi:CheY-like chemotaxis protein